MNQSLYMSTDYATSYFHRSGLSLFTAILALALRARSLSSETLRVMPLLDMSCK